MTECSESRCDRPVRARGLCSSHYLEKRRKAIEDGTWKPPSKGRTCDVPGCSRKYLSSGMCAIHYRESRKCSCGAASPSARYHAKDCTEAC